MQTPEVPGHVNPEVLGAGAVRVLLLKKVIYKSAFFWEFLMNTHEYGISSQGNHFQPSLPPRHFGYLPPSYSIPPTKGEKRAFAQ